MIVDQDVLDCLNKMLSTRGIGARVDTAEMRDSDLKDLAVQFERSAQQVVRQMPLLIPAAKGRLPYVFFLPCDGYSAFAARHPKYDYIVVNLGIVVRITSFFSGMMAIPGLWPEIGTPDVVAVEQDGTSLEDNDTRASSWLRLPKDSLRQAVAVVFMRECFDFIVRHEYAHLALGHCSTDKRDPIAEQVLELAADAHAASWGIRRLSRIPELLGRWPQDDVVDGFRVFHTTPYDAMRNYLLAMYLAFRISDEPDWTCDTLANRRHLPAPLRFHTACIQLALNFQRAEDTVAYNQLLGSWREAWGLGEFVFSKTLGREPNTTVKQLTMRKESEQHFYRILERSKTLPPDLLRLH